MDNFPVVSIVEQSVNNQVNALVGNKDTNLNTIVKMSLINEIKPIDDYKIQSVLYEIVSNNELEKELIEREYALTIDCCGNLIYVNGIYEGKEGEENS
jgi:hypothetical protein